MPKVMLRPLPLSISTLVSRFVPMIGSTMCGYLLGYGTLSGWSDRSKVMADFDHRRKDGVAGSAIETSRRVSFWQHLEL